MRVWGCPRDKSTANQARDTKLGTEVELDDITQPRVCDQEVGGHSKSNLSVAGLGPAVP